MIKLPRNFWRRGPAAYDLAIRAERYVIDDLKLERRHFLTLHATRCYLEISRKTLLRWIDEGLISRHETHKKIETSDLIQFLEVLIEKKRLPPPRHKRLGERPELFGILKRASFIWPKRKSSLTPRELAELIPCSPSTIIKALKSPHSRLQVKLQTRCRYKISRQNWLKAYPNTVKNSQKIY